MRRADILSSDIWFYRQVTFECSSMEAQRKHRADGGLSQPGTDTDAVKLTVKLNICLTNRIKKFCLHENVLFLYVFDWQQLRRCSGLFSNLNCDLFSCISVKLTISTELDPALFFSAEHFTLYFPDFYFTYSTIYCYSRLSEMNHKRSRVVYTVPTNTEQ